MELREAIKAMETQIQYLPISNDIVDTVRATAKELEIDILDEYVVNNAVTIFKLEVKNMYMIFQLGVFTHINNEVDKEKQKIIDELFKGRNLLS